VHLRRAVALDPRFARAYAALADCYMSLGLLAAGPPRDLFLQAKSEALQALALDPNLAEAHTSLAYLRFWQEWDWPGAESEFKRAITLNPDYATAHQWYAWHLIVGGRNEQGIRELRKAEALDPLSLIITADIADALVIAHRYEESMQQSRKAIEMDPKAPLSYISRGIGNYYMPEMLGGGPALALKDLDEALRLDPKSAEAHLWRGLALRKLHRNAEAHEELEKSVQLNPQRIWTKQQLEKTPAK